MYLSIKRNVKEKYLAIYKGLLFFVYIFSIKNVFPMRANYDFFIKKKECIII
jgi:hypothetical protein